MLEKSNGISSKILLKVKAVPQSAQLGGQRKVYEGTDPLMN